MKPSTTKNSTTIWRYLAPAGLLSLGGCGILYLLFGLAFLDLLTQVGCEQCLGSPQGLMLVANGTEGREVRESESPGLPPTVEVDQEPEEPGFTGALGLNCDLLLELIGLAFETEGASQGSASQGIVQLRSGGIAVSVAQSAAERQASAFAATLYMTNSANDTVLAVDSTSRRLLGSVRVGGRPRGIALTPDNQTLLVANEDSGDVSVVATNTLTQTARIALPGDAAPYDVAITPDGAEAWVTTHEASGFVHVIDIAGLAVSHSIRVGRRPAQVAISPDGTLAYVTNVEDNRLSILDVWTHSLQRSLTVPSPWGVEFDPTGARVYVTSHSLPGAVRMFDVASDAELASWEVGTKPEYMALDPLATRLFVTNRLSDFVSAINLLSGEVEREIPAPRGLGPLGFAP